MIGKGTPYLTSVIPLPSRGYSPRKPTVRSFYTPLPPPPPLFHQCISAPFYGYLKGLGHAILGNFSTDRMVIELTKISK